MPPRREAAAYVAKRLDTLLPEKERGWKGESTKNGGMIFTRLKHGVTSRYTLDADAIARRKPAALMA